MTPLHWQKSSFSEAGSTCLHLATAPPGISWQKSSFSGEGDACVHLAATRDDAVFLCESDTPDRVLTTSPHRLRPLISAIKTGRLSR
ncbi:DUF397 domain-containing protein [Streptomyces sp. NPDC001407]|uniref:DUF397 domain-containing protein n=1 Tax=Streptomyces sp. NPDC001407 TaxID=3364573 RepID=UPI0036BF9688